jgi:CheY-like chemotaxis protein
MQLVGNIEDLGLGEILQIVCFSRKSGTLKLNSRKREGSLVFKNGQVVRAASSVIKEGVYDIMIKEKLLTTEQLKNAIVIQKNDGFRESLESVLIKNLNLSAQLIEDTAIRQIEKSVLSLFLWRDGSFVFELGDLIETPEMRMNDPLQYTLTNGLNPQFMAMEGVRLQDEAGREEIVPEDEFFEEAPYQQEAAPLAVTAPTVIPTVTQEGMILVIDDDPLTRGVIRNHLVQMGFKASAFGQSEAGLRKVEELVSKQERPIVIADLFMPTMDGEGMLGGLEILGRLKTDFQDVPVIIITEHPNSKTEKEVRDLNAYSYLQKPKKLQFKDDVTTPAVAMFIEKLTAILSRLTRSDKTLGEPQFFMQEFLKEMEGGRGFLESGSAEPKVEESKGLRILKEMLVELSRPLSVSEIILLILRFSSEIMNRAVVFALKNDKIVGQGQFGIEINGEVADKRVREMAIPLNEPSVLTEALYMQTAIVKRLDPIQWNEYIVRKLGGHLPAESFVVPIIVKGKTALILYGDNAPTSDKIGDTSTLEIFLAQASMALERILLERRLLDQKK